MTATAVTGLVGARGALTSETALSTEGAAIMASYDADIGRSYSNDHEFGLHNDGAAHLKL